MSRGSRTMMCVGCAWALAAMLPASALAPAAASAPRAVRVGSVPVLPATAHRLAALPSTTELHVTVALKPRASATLVRFASAVGTPGSRLYHRYLTRAQFAWRFGATPTAIDAVRAFLRADGLSPGPTSPNRLSIPLTATAAALDRALSVSLERVSVGSRAGAIVNRLAPALDPRVAPLVQDVLGLDTLSSPQPESGQRSVSALAAAAAARPHVATGGPQPCAAATAAAPGNDAYTADQLASAYGLSGLYAAGDEGAGQTIALYELESDDPSDIAAYQSCYGTHAPVSYAQVDGGAGSGAGSGEAALDIETAIGLAPKARILVYQAPNSNSNGPGAGPYDNFSAIVSQDRAQVVSASWGQCEALEGAANAAAEQTLFEEAAAQGQTIVSAAGDDGSEDCYTGSPVSGTGSAVDDPASQPFVTGVGGTTLSQLGPRPSETVWNNGGQLGLLTGPLGITPGAGGGGVSSLWSMPAYQRSAPASLNVISGSSVRGCGGAYCREVPDVSADADPDTGYLIYYNGGGSESGASGWQGIGGTSASAPLWAAVLALTNASTSCHGSNLGFANPDLYRAAATSYGADFNDVTVGNNDFTGTNGSKYGAGGGYDLATGLGTPDAAALAHRLCAESLRLAAPNALSSTVERALTLRVRTSGGGGSAVRYTARGLPAGLKINSSTGVISGRPRRIGTSSVVLTATNSQGGEARAAFRWTIGGSPTLSGASLQGIAEDRPVLRFTVTRGRGAPKLHSLVVGLARGLRLKATRASHVRLTGLGGGQLRARAKIRRGTLTLTLLKATGRITVTISSGTLTAAHSLVVAVAAGDSERLGVRPTLTDALGNRTALSVRVKATG